MTEGLCTYLFHIEGCVIGSSCMKFRLECINGVATQHRGATSCKVARRDSYKYRPIITPQAHQNKQ